MARKDYLQMGPEQLEAELKRLRDNLEDLEDTFAFNLTNTSAHLNSGVVAEAEEELQELKDEIAKVQSLLGGGE